MVIPKLRVLYCEDDEDSREMMRLILAKEGFEVLCLHSPHDLLALAKEQRFDAYLLDSCLRELSGKELCLRIREFDSHTPIIFYSGAATDSDKDEAIAAGAQAYIIKPASIEHLIGTIRSTIKKSLTASA